MDELTVDEKVRSAKLRGAQAKAIELFDAVRHSGIIVPGVREIEASNSIRDLASEMFGVDRYWHKRIVRAGENTLRSLREDPPDRVLDDDDIVFCDFGPIFEQWEADVGRTYVIGDDPVKLKLRDSLPSVWQEGKAFFEQHEDVTGEQLYAQMAELGSRAGWELAGDTVGHLVGQYPHGEDDRASYIAQGNNQPMRRKDRNGQQCHWILEVHLVDRERKIGGFYEQLLDL